MRLYKMELYKICSKKLFICSAIAALTIIILYAGIFVVGAETTINGVKYTGLEAVKMDRKITEEWKGVLTDEKVAQIVERYGFPSGVSENYNYFLDRNFLNNFVMREFSDGYFHGRDDYHVATRVYPIAETKLGKASEASGKPIVLEYGYGWQVFNIVLEISCMVGIPFVLFALSPIFSEENYINMRQILFTTKEGKTRAVTAKIMAGITVAAGAYAVILTLNFVFVWSVFGLDGGECLYQWVMEDYVRTWNNYHNISTMYIRDFIWMAAVFCFIGIIEAASIILYFSAHCNSPFQSVIISALCLAAPVCVSTVWRGNFNSIMFIASQLSDVLLLGIAFTSFVPDISGRAGKAALKSLCCILPLSVGIYFRRNFPFYNTIPFMLVLTEGYSDIDIYLSRYPGIRVMIVLFAAFSSAAFIVCSHKKYKSL